MARKSDIKISRRKKHRTRVLIAAVRRCARVGAFVLGAAALVVLGRAAVDAPFLHIKHITLTGGGSLEEMAPVLAQSGIRTGSSIVTAQAGRASAVLLQHDPWIASVSIKRKLPNQIDIQVTQRTPAAVARMDRLYLLDTRGEIFTTLAEHDRRLPLITGLQREDFYVSGTGAQELLHSALLLIQQLKHQALMTPDTTVAIDTFLGLTLVNKSHNLRVRMGFSHFEKKTAALKRILQDLDSRQLMASIIDLSSESKAYVNVGT